MTSSRRLPISILTGFLGSGKTTLLARLLKSPELSRTAVIINEFGEIGLDHDLVEASDESFIELSTGCMCCTVRGDLVQTLRDLMRRRDAGIVPPFERIVIETSGLADPAPILHALMTDSALTERLYVAGVTTTVDTAMGHGALQRHPEAVKQIALADRLLLTKTDISPTGTDDLIGDLRKLNPSAPISISRFGDVSADCLFGGSGADTAASLGAVVAGFDVGADHHSHTSIKPDQQALAAVSFFRAAPIHALTLTLLLETLAEQCGADLLRVKGIVAITEVHDRPAVIHGVQHVFHSPSWLEHWPSADRRSRFVFIGRGLSRAWLEALIDTLDEEVRDAGRKVSPAGQRP